MNLSTFNTMVSASLRRGNTLDTFIPQQVAMAVQWMERNYTFKYMEQFRLVTIQGPSGNNPGQRVLAMPDGLIKAWIFFRIINADGSYKYLQKVEPKDMTLVNSTANTLIAQANPAPTTAVIVPGAFFQVGLSTIVLDAIPSQNFSCEAMFYGYSSWPTDPSTVPGAIPASTFDHPLLDIASDLLLAQAQMFMSVNIMKDMRMFQVYKEMRDEGVNTMTRAEDELKFGGENMKMVYDPEFDDRQINAATTIGF